MSMLKDYRLSLEKLANAPPKTKAALIRSLSPGIEAALNSGHSFKDIWEALGNEGLQMTYHVFHMTVWRARAAGSRNSWSAELADKSKANGRNRPGCDRFCLARIPGDHCGMFDVAGFKI